MGGHAEGEISSELSLAEVTHRLNETQGLLWQEHQAREQQMKELHDLLLSEKDDRKQSNSGMQECVAQLQASILQRMHLLEADSGELGATNDQESQERESLTKTVHVLLAEHQTKTAAASAAIEEALLRHKSWVVGQIKTRS